MDSSLVQKAEQIAYRFFTKFALVVDNARIADERREINKADKWVRSSPFPYLRSATDLDTMLVYSSTWKHQILRSTKDHCVYSRTYCRSQQHLGWSSNSSWSCQNSEEIKSWCTPLAIRPVFKWNPPHPTFYSNRGYVVFYRTHRLVRQHRQAPVWRSAVHPTRTTSLSQLFINIAFPSFVASTPF